MRNISWICEGLRGSNGAASVHNERSDRVKYSTVFLYFSCIKQEHSAHRRDEHPSDVWLDPSVAVFVLLPRAARAGGVAWGARVDAGRRGRGRGGSAHRHRACAEAAGSRHDRPPGRPGGAALALGEGGLAASLLLLRHRILAALDAQLDMAEDAGDRLAQAGAHGPEHLAGLALRLVQGIPLRV